jgi:putative sigma-54 modulation protein
MKLSYTFKHMDSSPALIQHVEEQLNRMSRYELKPYDIHFSFSMLRHQRTCDVLVTGPNVRIRAEGQCNDIYEALDLALDKVERQLSRRKEKVQHHHKRKVTDLEPGSAPLGDLHVRRTG